jgi:hypothetical protein
MPGFFQAVSAAPSTSTPSPGGIVTTNLTNWLDFSNASCYPGSGTTINDLVDSLTYNANGATFLSGTNGGVFEFDGVNDSIFANTDRDLIGSFSVGVWFKKNTTTLGNMALFVLEDSGTDGYRHLIDEDTGSYYLRARPNGNNHDDPTGLADLTWYYFAATWNDSTQQLEGYKNASSIVSTSIATSVNVAAERIVVGAGANGSNTSASIQFFKGYIGEVHFYDRGLSAAEITQNFNATRSRYGV